MKLLQGAALAVLVAAAGEAASAPEHQAVTGPVATYWISADTESGFGAGAPGGPGGYGGPGGQRPPPPKRPGFGDMMAMEMGGRDPREVYGNGPGSPYGPGGPYGGGPPNANSVQHLLTLQLGSSRKAQGEPLAEHDPPPTLGAGDALPLVTPLQQAVHQEAGPGQPPPQYQPQGRVLIYWGCGEHAAHPPVVIDLADAAHGGAQFAALARGLAISQPSPPSPARDATYGEWPNTQSQKTVPGDGSLQGDHLVRSNYAPDIKFSLTADQDFLPPIKITTNEKTPTGAVALAWHQVDGAQGLIATAFGSQGQGQTVMWTSADVEALAFGLPDYLSDGEIARLVKAQVLMPGSQTSCTVPSEVAHALGTGAFRLIAYGGETNLSYPPRPPAPKPWRIDWQVKIRYRASTGGILGMDLEKMMGGAGGQPPPDQPQPRRHGPFGF